MLKICYKLFSYAHPGKCVLKNTSPVLTVSTLTTLNNEKTTMAQKLIMQTNRRGAPSVLALGDIWCAGRHSPALGAAVVGLVGAQGEGTGRGRAGTDKGIWE